MYKFSPGILLMSCSKFIQAYHISNRWNPWKGVAVLYVEELLHCKTVLVLGCNFLSIYAGTDIYINKIFLGYQLRQLVKSHQLFRDHLCSHHQGSDVTACPDCPKYISAQSPYSNLSVNQWGLVGGVKCLLCLALP
jgi:hypothetical protein